MDAGGDLERLERNIHLRSFLPEGTIARMRTLIRMLVCSCALLLPAAALAQAYPSKPVRLIVPFPRGARPTYSGAFSRRA